MSRKKETFLLIDVETANTTQDALVYDIGYIVANRSEILETHSFIISDIFEGEKNLMKSAYYAEKIPFYYNGLHNNEFILTNFYSLRRRFYDLFKRYNIKKIYAYNAHFDITALNTTLRFLTGSKYRFFFPYGVEIGCIWSMACQVICTQKKYIQFCIENNFVSSSGNISTSAETVYRYMQKLPEFDEAHTGLQDVLIEYEILKKCFAQHKKMNTKINRLCWKIPQKARKEKGL